MSLHRKVKSSFGIDCHKRGMGPFNYGICDIFKLAVNNDSVLIKTKRKFVNISVKTNDILLAHRNVSLTWGYTVDPA